MAPSLLVRVDMTRTWCYSKGGGGQMTTVATMTLDQFEARTYDALAGVTRVRRALRHHGRVLLAETVARLILQRFMAALSNEWLAAMDPDKSEETGRRLSELRDKLTQVIQIGDAKGF